jgi:LPS O-antigen subunit length determinant protein (WzzB/FepE family)
MLLNRKTYSAADANLMLLDGNPAFAAPSVSAEISARDKTMQSLIYSEIVKNLEISKTALIQETPTVQVVDSPEMPLKKNKWSKLIFTIIGFLIGFVGTGLLINKNSAKQD